MFRLSSKDFIASTLKQQCKLPQIPFCLPQYYHPSYDLINRKYFMLDLREKLKRQKQRNKKCALYPVQTQQPKVNEYNYGNYIQSESPPEQQKYKRISSEFQELMNRYEPKYINDSIYSSNSNSNSNTYVPCQQKVASSLSCACNSSTDAMSQLAAYYQNAMQYDSNSNYIYNINYDNQHTSVDPLNYMNITELSKIAKSIKNDEFIEVPQLDYLINFIIVAADFQPRDILQFLKLLNEITEITPEVITLLETIVLSLTETMGAWKFRYVKEAIEKAKASIFKYNCLNTALLAPTELEGIFTALEEGRFLHSCDYIYLQNFLKEILKLEPNQKKHFLTNLAARGTLTEEATEFLKYMISRKKPWGLYKLKIEIENFKDLLKRLKPKRKSKHRRSFPKKIPVTQRKGELTKILQESIREAMRSNSQGEQKLYILARRTTDGKFTF